MKEYNFTKGRNGEEFARIHLEEKGYEFVEGNHLNVGGEIDLIMAKDGVLVFVEVKLKTDDRFGYPEEMIDKRKLARVRKAAEIYLCLMPDMRQKYKKYRVDAVCIEADNMMRIQRISHYENIY